jgi:tape measure domain-containing protein
MSEIDPVVLRLIVERGQFLSDMNNISRVVDRRFGAMERDVISLERQMRASLGGITTAMKGLAAAAGVGLSIGQISSMADQYTRYTNQLKVAGLEGQALADTQERLFQVAQRNGVELEAVGTLYSRAAQNQKELGASTEELIGLTRAVAASLRISGTSTQEASGALLQLGQALGSPRIQAEEFNSLIDTMQPLLRGAAKYIDGTGGSLAGLTRKIKNTSGPGVSAVELFRAINQSLADLEKQASSSNMTIAQSLTVLNNALGKYIGETDNSLSATARLSQGIAGFAENLDTIIPAIATLATVIGVRYVGAAIAATGATLAQAAANVREAQTAAARAAIEANLSRLMLGTAGAANAAAASVTRLSVAQGVAARAGSGLLALMGGPWVAAALALGGAIYYAKTEIFDTKEATGAYATELEKAQDETARAEELSLKLATARGEERKKTLAAASAERELTKQKIASAKASIDQAKAELARARARFADLQAGAQSAGWVSPEAATGAFLGATITGAGGVNQAEANLAGAQETLNRYEKKLKTLESAIEGGVPSISPPADEDGKKKRKSAGRSAADIESDHQRELSRLRIEELQARLDLATNAEDRADLSEQILAEEKAARIAEVRANKDLSEKQRQAEIAQLEKLYGPEAPASGEIPVGNSLYQQQINRGMQDQLDRESLDIKQAQIDNDQDILRSQSDLAESRQERRDLELKLLDLAYEQERNELDAVLASQTATQAQKDIAAARLAILDQLKGYDAARIGRDYESPMERQRREVREAAANMGDAIESIEVDAVDRLADGLANASTEYIKLGGIAGDVINGIIQDLVRLAAKQAILGSGGGGIIGSIGKFLGIAGGLSSSGIAAANQTVGSTIAERPDLFQSGGYTGDGPVNEPAGIVHKGEYVVPADAVRRIGVQNLAALTNARAAASMAGVTAAGAGARPVQQTVVVKVEANDYFDARVDQRAAGVAAPMAVASGLQARSAAGSDVARKQRRQIPG